MGRLLLLLLRGREMGRVGGCAYHTSNTSRVRPAGGHCSCSSRLDRLGGTGLWRMPGRGGERGGHGEPRWVMGAPRWPGSRCATAACAAFRRSCFLVQLLWSPYLACICYRRPRLLLGEGFGGLHPHHTCICYRCGCCCCCRPRLLRGGCEYLSGGWRGRCDSRQQCWISSCFRGTRGCRRSGGRQAGAPGWEAGGDAGRTGGKGRRGR